MDCFGGKSNTGEGGGDAGRSNVLPNGDTMRSAIQQVALGASTTIEDLKQLIYHLKCSTRAGDQRRHRPEA